MNNWSFPGTSEEDICKLFKSISLSQYLVEKQGKTMEIIPAGYSVQKKKLLSEVQNFEVCALHERRTKFKYSGGLYI
jgi:hypothetical protein